MIQNSTLKDDINNSINKIFIKKSTQKNIKNIHQNNSKCYYFNTQKYNTGLFDSCIDMAYVLTMVNSLRLPKLNKELSEHKPSTTIVFQYNQGFRKCKKKLKHHKSNYDLTDAYRNVFLNALVRGYSRILVMEDDFFMRDYKIDDIERICEFIKKNNPHAYNLGASMCQSNIFDTLNDQIYHYKCDFSTATHAVIYNESFMKDFVIAASKGQIKQCDRLWNDKKYNTYTYYKPIAFQLIPETENMETWYNNKFNATVDKSLIKMLKLDTNHENFRFRRDIGRYLPLCVILFTIMVIIVIVIIFIKMNKKNPKIR